MDPRSALIAAMMSQPPQGQMPPGYQQVAAQPPGVQPLFPMARVAALAKLNTDNALAARGLPAAGSPATPFSQMSTQPIPLQ